MLGGLREKACIRTQLLGVQTALTGLPRYHSCTFIDFIFIMCIKSHTKICVQWRSILFM